MLRGNIKTINLNSVNNVKKATRVRYQQLETLTRKRMVF